jgi:hypothetical protein
MTKTKQTKKTTLITIPKPSMIFVEAEVVGTPPGILLNPFDANAEAQLLASMQKSRAKLTRPDKDPEAEFIAKRKSLAVPGKKNCYWLDVLAFKGSMTRGAKTVEKLAMTDFRAGVMVQMDSVIGTKAVAHIHGAAIRHSTHVVVSGGRPDYRTRVLLPEWKCTIKFTVNETLLSVEQALTCLVNAGVGVGVADWRPEKRGVHGCFNVEGCRATKMSA